MNEARLARKHKLWLRQGCEDHQWMLKRLRLDERYTHLYLNRQKLMLLTLKPRRLKALLQGLQNRPLGSINELSLDLMLWNSDDDCLNPPSEEAMLATATQLAHVMSRFDSLRQLLLFHTSVPIASAFLASCSRLESVQLAFLPLVPEATFSIKTLRNLSIRVCAFPDRESIAVFCRGIESSSLEGLSLSSVTFPPEHEAQVASTLARCNTLVTFSCSDRSDGSGSLFCEHYCSVLANNADTKLEELHLSGQDVTIHLRNDHGTATGPDPAIISDIRLLLGLNVQRKEFGPLFVAIEDAETDLARRKSLVEAFSAAACPLMFEYIRSNQYNLISMIQQLGRSETDRCTKRQRMC